MKKGILHVALFIGTILYFHILCTKVSEWLSMLYISSWITYPLTILLAFLPVILLRRFPNDYRWPHTGLAFGLCIATGILSTVICHWADRNIAVQIRYKEIRYNEFLNSPSEWTFAYLPCDTFLYSHMISNIRYNLDDDKKYQGEFLVPFIPDKNKQCLVWIYEQDHYGQKRENELIRSLKEILNKESKLAFEICSEPTFSWIDFKNAEIKTLDLGFSQYLIVKRRTLSFETKTLVFIKTGVFYFLTAIGLFFLLWLLYKGLLKV